MRRPAVLFDFRSVTPAHTIAQADSLEWLAKAHAHAEAQCAARAGHDVDEAALAAQFFRRLAHFGCGGDKIAFRGHELPDCGHTRWSDMEVYRLDDRPEGVGTFARTRAFSERAARVIARFYAEETSPPADLVHVTCTGYASPSAAQIVTSEMGWGACTRVTHAYHMGCYAAFPALRIARGLVLAGEDEGRPQPRRADVVHTEMCSLHLDPLRHDPEQFVIQSLFADGFIRYSVCSAADFSGGAPALSLLSQDETILPDSSQSMTWVCSSHGMQMTLGRDVPERLAGGVRSFVGRLCEAAGLDEDDREHAVYAVHPGGPRILDRVSDVLSLREEQIESSRRVLRERGNMSSATVPHIWMDIARAPQVRPGRAIVSLAFGPGLTLCGAVLRKGAH